jgi:Cof subfamily protein (haloacid dehalogenase superfamily)
MFKLIVTDVDNTLLDERSRLSSFNKKALEECIASGIGIILATGKTFNSISYLIKKFKLSLPQIVSGGTVTVMPNGKVIDYEKIEPETYHKFIKDIRGKGYEPLVMAKDGKIYYQNYRTEMANAVKIGQTIVKVDNLEEDYFVQNAVCLNLVITETDPIENYIKQNFGGKLSILRTSQYFFDSINLKASKGNALKKIANNLGIAKNEIIAFGDSHNDISLFQESGFSVAVKNSYPELLSLADAVTEESYNSGFGKAVYKYVLNKAT